jgi:hypothetical protein
MSFYLDPVIDWSRDVSQSGYSHSSAPAFREIQSVNLASMALKDATGNTGFCKWLGRRVHKQANPSRFQMTLVF